MRKIGASFTDGLCTFSVWAPEKEAVNLQLVGHESDLVAMAKDRDGYFTVQMNDVPPGTRYFFIPEESEAVPDPASHYQPDGVHGASEVVDHGSFSWTDQSWSGIPQQDLILYEIHVGTFTEEGTFDAVIEMLDHLADLGVNAIELMPVSQFPGDRNWGYDGVFPLAVQNSYGGPQKLKSLVDAAHKKGIAVFLDVVFNHIGPEGNYFENFGPYFTKTYSTPWGNAINLDGAWSDGVREYFCGAVIHWYEHYHIDGLRVDAVHMMYDSGAVNFWELVQKELEKSKQAIGRNFYLIAESDLNSPKTVAPPENGGLGFDVQWLDDFHHALYVLLDPDGQDRYEDFGTMQQLAKAYTDGFVHSGEYVKFRKRKHGASSVSLPGNTFVVFNQNHDQVGNRVGGERLSMLISFERQKIAAAATLLSPYLPMLFMGEEFSADSTFFYFVSHSEEELIKMVVEGRRKEFENYKWDVDPPNPQDPETFQRSKLNWAQKDVGVHKIILNWHKALISLRQNEAVFQNYDKDDVTVTLFGQRGLCLHRRSADGNQDLFCVFNLGHNHDSIVVPHHRVKWKKMIDSHDAEWQISHENQGDPLAGEVFGGEVIYVPGLGITAYLSAD